MLLQCGYKSTTSQVTICVLVAGVDGVPLAVKDQYVPERLYMADDNLSRECEAHAERAGCLHAAAGKANVRLWVFQQTVGALQKSRFRQL
jgi:hypothetical protein